MIRVSHVGDIMRWLSEVTKLRGYWRTCTFHFLHKGSTLRWEVQGFKQPRWHFYPEGWHRLKNANSVRTAATYGRHYLSQTGGRLAALTNFWSQREFREIYTPEVFPDQITSYMESNVSSLLQRHRKLPCFHERLNNVVMANTKSNNYEWSWRWKGNKCGRRRRGICIRNGGKPGGKK